MLTKGGEELLESERKRYEARIYLEEKPELDYTLPKHDFVSIPKIEKSIADVLKNW